MRRSARLILDPDGAHPTTHPFLARAVIGRRGGPSGSDSCRIVIESELVSGRHCVVRQEHDGRFWIRDESRNGTRVDGRRLVPTVAVELVPGERIQLPEGHLLELQADELAQEEVEDDDVSETIGAGDTQAEATVLVGDLLDYTKMSRTLPPQEVLAAVQRVFRALAEVIAEHQGTTWEYGGDAVLAFWERDDGDPTWHVRRACSAALALNELAQRMAGDASVWTIEDFPLRLDWALSTGPVMMAPRREGRSAGHVILGAPVLHAVSLEKLVGPATGPIVVDAPTQALALEHFGFRSLGERTVGIADEAEPLYGLVAAIEAGNDGLDDAEVFEVDETKELTVPPAER